MDEPKMNPRLLGIKVVQFTEEPRWNGFCDMIKIKCSYFR